MEPTKCCTACGHPLMKRSTPFVDMRDLRCATCGGFGLRKPDEEPATLRAVLCSLVWWAVVVVAVALLAFAMAPPALKADELPRWAAVKWDKGIPLMADYGVPQSKGECETFVSRRNAAYSHAGVSARWTCRDMWADLGRET